MTNGSSSVLGKNESTQALPWPPGNSAHIAQFVYNAAPRPNREVAVAATLGLLAGMCGRQWQVSNTGLNIYIILVARSATGKEAMQSGIASLIDAVSRQVPMANGFVEFGDFASGQALIKVCAKNLDVGSFVNVAGEFGYKFAQIASRHTNAAMTSLRRALNDLYMKSGAQAIMGGIRYSKADDNIESVQGVSYSMLGETTPGTLYEAVTPEMMVDGFMSRFTIIQYHGERPDENLAPVFSPSKPLVDGLAQLAQQALNLKARSQFQPVSTDSDAQQQLDAFKRECDGQIRTAGDEESRRQMWNRAHLKSLRIAALLAVADNCYSPMITTPHATWAIDLIRRDIQTFTARLDSGEVGEADDAARKAKVFALLIKYLQEPPEKYVALRDVHMVPDQYLQTRTQNIAAFKNHPLGANKALKQTVEALIEGGQLMRVAPQLVAERVPKAKGACYLIQELPGFDNPWKAWYREKADVPWLKQQE